MQELIPFQFGIHAIRVQLDEHGNPWWIAKDICDALGIQNPADTVKRLSPLESTIIDLIYDGMPRRFILVNESGLYRIIFRSDKPEAKKFQDWVFCEVLPQIRKTGTFTAVPALLIPTPESQFLLIQKAAELLKFLGHLTERDTLMLSDQVRNVMQAGQRLLPAGTSGTVPQAVYGFSVAERVEQLGYHLTRKEQAGLYPGLGKKIASEWRSRYGKEPIKESRFVDGAQRSVAWYAGEETSWIDPIIQAACAQKGFQLSGEQSL